MWFCSRSGIFWWFSGQCHSNDVYIQDARLEMICKTRDGKALSIMLPIPSSATCNGSSFSTLHTMRYVVPDSQWIFVHLKSMLIGCGKLSSTCTHLSQRLCQFSPETFLVITLISNAFFCSNFECALFSHHVYLKMGVCIDILLMQQNFRIIQPNQPHAYETWWRAEKASAFSRWCQGRNYQAGSCGESCDRVHVLCWSRIQSWSTRSVTCDTTWDPNPGKPLCSVSMTPFEHWQSARHTLMHCRVSLINFSMSWLHIMLIHTSTEFAPLWELQTLAASASSLEQQDCCGFIYTRAHGSCGCDINSDTKWASCRPFLIAIITLLNAF